MLRAYHISILSLLAMAPGQALGLDLASFRAVYDLQPIRVNQGNKVMPVDGKLAYEVTGSPCAGWTVSTKLANRMVQGDQGIRTTEIKSNSYEPDDGMSMNISQQESTDGHLSNDEELKIRRTDMATETKGSITGSKSLSFTLKPDVIFPTEHQKRLLAAAANGLRRDVSNVFDGSDSERAFHIITFISQKHATPQSSQVDLSALSNLKSWTFQLGYYSINASQDEAPEFQTTFDMYENGVSTEMLFDYGSYAMKAKISELDLLPTPSCSAEPAKLQ